jgi:Fe-S cluster assembly protein SufD
LASLLAERRERAAELLGTLELPEFKGRPGWEFTDLSGFDPSAYPSAPADGASAIPLFDLPVDAELPSGVIVSSIEEAAELHPELIDRYLGSVVTDDADPFKVRNDAALRDGGFVYVPRGVVVETPILLTAVQSASGTELARHTLVVLDEGAQAEVWEQQLSAQEDLDGVFNTVVELVVGDGARLRFICGQALSERSWIFGTHRAEVGRDGSLDWVALGLGSARGRVRMETRLGGTGAEARVTGAYASHGRQHIDYDTTQEHAAPNTTSDLAFRGVLAGRSSAVWKGNIIVDPGAQKTDAFQESRNLLISKRAHADAIPGLEIQANDVRCTHAAPNTTSDLAFRGVLAGRSSAVWKGNIIVDPGAQKTDAFQESRNLLISKRAHADAIPGLEIQANDVRCTHAAAVAQVDPDQLFYLRSHGLPEAVAKRLVIEGFLAALVERFEQGPLRERLAAALERRLNAVLEV